MSSGDPPQDRDRRATVPGPIVTTMPAPPAPPAPAFNWDDLGRYKQASRFLDGYPSDVRTFYSPVDDVHGVLAALLSST